MKIRYNSPVTLTFALGCLAILIADQFTSSSFSNSYFTVFADFDSGSFWSYFRLISHIMGHANWAHLVGNMTFILLLGPILEEKYGSIELLEMIVVTGLITGILNVVFLPTGLKGASGIVFMMILLSSITNIKSREVPLTFILIAGLYLTREISAAFANDSISQFAHIIGGLCGGLFGFSYATVKKRKAS